MSIFWNSIDPGTKLTGVAQWCDDQLLSHFVIKPCGSKGYYWIGERKVDSKLDAWLRILKCKDLVVMERGAGRFPVVINGQAKIRGYIEALCEVLDTGANRVEEINVSEWKRVIKEDQNISWPKQSERQKALAQKLVQEIYGKSVSEDEADAILIGHAAIRMGFIK